TGDTDENRHCRHCPAMLSAGGGWRPGGRRCRPGTAAAAHHPVPPGGGLGGRARFAGLPSLAVPPSPPGATHQRLAPGAGGAPQGEAGRLGIAGLKLVWPGMAGGEHPRPRGRRARLHRSRPGAVAPALPVLGNPGPCPGGGGMTTPTLLASPFRPFFLLAGIQGAILVPLWLGILLGGWPAPALDPLRWHVHEMLFGLGGAAIAGFLLTAMANWTGTRALDGWGLLVLALAWLLGRLGP